MKQQALDDVFQTHFDWPEPLVIDAICDTYGDVLDATECMRIARLQAKTLRGIFEGGDKKSTVPRLELIAQCAVVGIGREQIAQADRAVFWELTKLIASRFRTSPRNRSAHGRSLQIALDRLAMEKMLPTKRPRTTTVAAYAR